MKLPVQYSGIEVTSQQCLITAIFVPFLTTIFNEYDWRSLINTQIVALFGSLSYRMSQLLTRHLVLPEPSATHTPVRLNSALNRFLNQLQHTSRTILQLKHKRACMLPKLAHAHVAIATCSLRPERLDVV